jgi:hypothetical protein
MKVTRELLISLSENVAGTPEYQRGYRNALNDIGKRTGRAVMKRHKILLVTAFLLFETATVFASRQVFPITDHMPPPAGCPLTQPVYSADYKDIGTWQVTLERGQSVTLPDGDTATCTGTGTLYVP